MIEFNTEEEKNFDAYISIKYFISKNVIGEAKKGKNENKEKKVKGRIHSKCILWKRDIPSLKKYLSLSKFSSI